VKPTVLLFGASGILGFHLARTHPKHILPFVPPGNQSPAIRHWSVLHLENLDWISLQCETHTPQILIYCHAVCDVSKCEADPNWANEMNVAHLRRVLEVLPPKTRFIYVSSDHVFGEDGRYTERSSPCPISVYGRTRVEAETLVLKRAASLIIRPGLSIGASPNGRTGHLDWLRYRAARNLPITIIKDESRSAVWVADLSKRVMQLSESAETGIRHVQASRLVSRVALANFLAGFMGIDLKFKIESRHQQAAPHIGRVEMASHFHDEFSAPLPSVIENLT